MVMPTYGHSQAGLAALAGRMRPVGQHWSKSFPVEKLSAAAAGFLIGGGSLAYRLDSTWKLIDWRRRRTAAVPGSMCVRACGVHACACV